ncbi:hypothetical protein B0H15DRAFT_947762 [Mycena belliarum]|uniref:Uncharacterized protein n=1 Tax=Mycena belliarum TaxID=1033014 RepID=A0AAD6XSX6_9AGAR|nr:hypothetical protein B0H15DRAFT_947762 [Mycena belliae]
MAVDDSYCPLHIPPAGCYSRRDQWYYIPIPPYILLTHSSAVPLSAYEIDQEFTYRPTDTLPPLPLSHLIPGMFQHQTGAFNPQILTVGDVIQLNNSIFNFTITEAFDAADNTQPVSSFSYYNNPFSDGCDVTNMTTMLTIDRTSPFTRSDVSIQLDMTVTVTCHIPTLFSMTWSGTLRDKYAWSNALSTAQEDVLALVFDILNIFKDWSVSHETSNITLSNVAIEPCCECHEYMSPPADLPDADSAATQAPCSSRPARLMVISQFAQISDEFEEFDAHTLAVVFHNHIQSLYHLVRLELGVILDNQIYTSPEMYNRSISPVGDADAENANDSRRSTSNATVMAKWMETARFFEESDCVPVMPYLRSVPRVKPLGSAIISVFTSTFAMLSVAWTVFNVIATALAQLRAGEFRFIPSKA